MPPKQPGQPPSPPSLYEHFQDTQVTVFGQTGTLGELAEMCPVPAEQRDPKAMDRFTANVLQTAGIEIPEQFAAVLEPKPEPEHAEPQKLETQDQDSYKAPEEQVEPEIEPGPEKEKPALAVKDALPLALAEKTVVIQPPSEQQLIAVLRQQDELHKHAEQIAEPQAKVTEKLDLPDPQKNSKPVLSLPKIHTGLEKPAEKAEPKPFIAEQKPVTKAIILPVIPAELKEPITIDHEPASPPAAATKVVLPETSPEIPASPGFKAPAPTVETTAVQPLPLAEQPAAVLPDPAAAEIVATDEVILPEPQPDHYPLEFAEPVTVAIEPLEPGLEPSQITGETGLSLSEDEDDSWIDALLLAHQLEAKDRAKAARETVLSEFTKSLEVTLEATEETATQTEKLLVALPETVQDSLVEHIETAEPEAAAKLEALVVKIAPAADRLHELAVNGQLDTPEADQIEQELTEWYQELLTHLEIEPDAEKTAVFIGTIRSKTYNAGTFQADQAFKDTLHERKTGHGSISGFAQVARSLVDAVSGMEAEIARLMVRLSTKSPNPSPIA